MSHWISVAGWTLVHFVWEGCVLLVLALVVLRLCRQTTAAVRYSVAGAALALMLAAPIATAVVLTRPDVEPSTLERTRSAFSLSESQASTPSGFWPVVVPTAATVALVERSLPMVVIAWLCGVGLLLIRVGGGLWRVHRLRRKGLARRQSPWQAAVDRLAVTVQAWPLGRSFGLNAHVHVAESALVSAPTVVGWLRPAVLLPLAALAQLTPRQVEAILVHEFAHVRRHDYAVNLLQTLAETLVFYHPAVCGSRIGSGSSANTAAMT